MELRKYLTIDWYQTISKRQLKECDGDWGSAIETYVGDTDWMAISENEAVCLDCGNCTIGLVVFK